MLAKPRMNKIYENFITTRNNEKERLGLIFGMQSNNYYKKPCNG